MAPRRLFSRSTLCRRTPSLFSRSHPYNTGTKEVFSLDHTFVGEHQGVFPPDHKTPKPIYFLGVNIALSSNLIGSSGVDFHKDSKFGLNSKITFGTKESFVQTTAELACLGPLEGFLSSLGAFKDP